jgi:hypothetical protein
VFVKLFEVFDQRIGAQRRVVCRVDLVRLEKPFEKFLLDAKNKSGVRGRENIHVLAAAPAESKIRFAARRSDDRQIVCFDRDFDPPLFCLIHLLSSLIFIVPVGLCCYDWFIFNEATVWRSGLLKVLKCAAKSS